MNVREDGANGDGCIDDAICDLDGDCGGGVILRTARVVDEGGG